MSLVQLQSNDGEVFAVDVEVAEQSRTIRALLQSSPLHREGEIVPLPQVNADILRKVIEWCTYHKNDAASPPVADEGNGGTRAVVCSWDADFMNVDTKTFFDIILAAYHLDIKGLLDMTCERVASMIKGHSPEEQLKLINIQVERL
jgi:S-phase kinase-associated protein 1